MRLTGGDQSLNATIAPTGEDDVAGLPRRRPAEAREIVTEHTTEARGRAGWRSPWRAERPRERAIIHERRLRETAARFEELGVRLGISKERVRRSSIAPYRS